MTIDLVLAAVADYHTNAATYMLHQDYHDGKHRHSYASAKFRRKYGWVLRQATENLCPAVVDAYVDRLAVADWGTDDEATREGMDRLAALVHTEAFVAGDAYTVTWRRPDTDEPMPVFHRAHQIVPFVDEEQPDRLLAAAKIWVDPDGYARINIYDQDKLTRWRSTQKATVLTFKTRSNPARLPDTAAAWQELDRENAPAEEPHDFQSVPVCWWKRKAPSQFDRGVSLLRDIVSPQDRLNKVIADAVVAAERIAQPIRYILDVNPEQMRPRLNPQTGLMEPPAAPFDEAVNTLLMHSAKGPAGQFEGPNAEHLIRFKNDAEDEISRVAGVPAYYLGRASGQVPSGASLRVVTSRLVSGVGGFQRDAGPVWKGQLELLGWPTTAIQWAAAHPVDDTEKLEQAEAKKRLGYPLRDILEDLGEPDPEDILARAEAERAVDAANVGRAFRNGNITT